MVCLRNVLTLVSRYKLQTVTSLLVVGVVGLWTTIGGESVRMKLIERESNSYKRDSSCVSIQVSNNLLWLRYTPKAMPEALGIPRIKVTV